MSANIVTTKLTRIHTVHVDCGLGRRVAAKVGHAHPAGGGRFTYRWHKFRCDGHFVSSQHIGVGTQLKFECFRNNARERVRYLATVID